MAKKSTAKPTRLSDLAKAAGVSKGTASNVFNRPSIVRPEVREHVLNIAREMGYHGPDPRGRMLSAGKVNAIGVVTTEALSYFFTDPFNRELMAAISEVCDQQGVGISLISAANDESLAWNMRNAVVDGFILFCLEGNTKLVELSQERSLPVVALVPSEEDENISVLGIDNFTPCKEAAEYLVHLGHRNIAILTMDFCEDATFGPISEERILNALYQTTAERLDGYLEGLKAYGILPSDVPVHETRCDADTVNLAMESLFSSPTPPTAILAQSDKIALYALDWLNEKRIKVPEEVSIIGFDGILETQTSHPPLTTITQPIHDIGRKAVELLLQQNEGRHKETFPTELIVRESTVAPLENKPSNIP